MSAEITEAALAANEEIKLAREASILVRKQLEEGVDISIAYSVIDRYWDAEDARGLKVKMTNTFPRTNGIMLLEAPFNEKMGAALTFPAVRAYISLVIPAIVTHVERVYKAVNDADLNDEVALHAFNEFRKHPTKFLDLIEGMYGPEREKVLDGTYADWRDIPVSERIENGDYLFLYDYRTELAKAEKNVLEDLFGRPDQDDEIRSIQSVEYLAERIRVKVRLCTLFHHFLENLPED